MGNDHHLSRDKSHLAKLQRLRRASMHRIDYMPGRQAMAVFKARQAQEQPGSIEATNSAVLDAILIEWAELTGIKKPEVQRPKTSATCPELCDPKRARAYDFGSALPTWAAKWQAEKANSATSTWVRCGARRHRDGQPCRAMSEPGKRRCRFHGGRSTGPKTETGKVRALANLRQFRRRTN